MGLSRVVAKTSKILDQIQQAIGIQTCRHAPHSSCSVIAGGFTNITTDMREYSKLGCAARLRDRLRLGCGLGCKRGCGLGCGLGCGRWSRGVVWVWVWACTHGNDGRACEEDEYVSRASIASQPRQRPCEQRSLHLEAHPERCARSRHARQSNDWAPAVSAAT